MTDSIADFASFADYRIGSNASIPADLHIFGNYSGRMNPGIGRQGMKKISRARAKAR